MAAGTTLIIIQRKLRWVTGGTALIIIQLPLPRVAEGVKTITTIVLRRMEAATALIILKLSFCRGVAGCDHKTKTISAEGGGGVQNERTDLRFGSWGRGATIAKHLGH